jgi:mono/diheme cytochrome c family protein
MIKRSGLVFMLLLAVLDNVPAMAADVNHGRQLARRWCISCHLVVRDSTADDDRSASVCDDCKPAGL